MDPSNAPVRHARIQLTTPSEREIAKGTSDSSGAAGFRNIEKGLYVIEVAAEHFEPYRALIHVEEGTPPLRIPLTLATVFTAIEVRDRALLPPVAGVAATNAEIMERPSVDLVETLSMMPGVNILRQENGTASTIQ